MMSSLAITAKSYQYTRKAGQEQLSHGSQKQSQRWRTRSYHTLLREGHRAVVAVRKAGRTNDARHDLFTYMLLLSFHRVP